MISLFIEITLFNILKAKIVTFPINVIIWDNHSISIYFPNDYCSPFQFFNTFLSYTVLEIDDIYLDSNHIINKETLYLEHTFKASLYNMDISIENVILFNFLFYTNKYSDNGFKQDYGLSLGYHYKNESFSIVHNLYNSKHIEHLQFAIHNIKECFKDNHSHLYIGGVPYNAHLSLPYKGTIKINEALPTWGFNLKAIIYNNTKYKIALPCIISNRIDEFFISDDLYDIMINNIFNTDIDKERCKNIKQKRDEYSRY